MAKILIACEFSGITRDAFISAGHDAYSCDIIPSISSKNVGKHILGDCREILSDGWDLMIAHPPCTHLAVSGARHFAQKIKDGRQQEALEFVVTLMNAPIHRICIENPSSIISTKIRKPSQVINPYQFGHLEKKRTCLWLKNLPALKPTTPEIIGKHLPSYCHTAAPSKTRGMDRSVSYTGIAKAMANQWGILL